MRSERTHPALSGTQVAAAGLSPMAQYFFDTRDNEEFVEDEIGLELPDVQTAKAQAALSLAELARDVLPGCDQRMLTVEVRDEHQSVMHAKLVFHAIMLNG